MKASVLKFQPKARADVTSTGDELHIRLVRWVEDAATYFEDANDRASRDRDYYDGRQWSDEDVAEREEASRSAVTMNRIGRKVRFLKGYETQHRISPTALPRTPAHEQAAEVATEGLRYVADLCRLDQVFSVNYEFLLIEGIEIAEVSAKQEGDGIDPDVNVVNWDRFIYDPYSRELDFSDARYLGVVTWMDYDDALEKWPDAADILDNTYTSENTDTYDDVPQWTQSLISGRQRARFVQLYWQEKGTWMHAIFTRYGFLEAPKPSIWLDEHGKPECPIIAACAFVNGDNERYGIVREMIDAQDEINIRHSSAIDFMSTRQTLGEKGAVEDVNDAKMELLKPKGHVEITPGMRFEVLPTDDLSRGNAEALTLARQEIDLMGPNASMMGKDSKAPSGRAIIAQQEGGVLEIAPINDCHRDFQLRVYRAVWHRIKQFWKSEKWVRVTDDQNKPRFIGLNVPVTYGQMLAEQNGGQVPPDVAMRYGPLLNQPAKIQNDVSYLDIDIVLDTVPHSAIMQQEQFDSLIELAKIAGGLGQRIPFKAILMASSIRDKDKIIKEIEDSSQGGQQAQAQQAELVAKRVASEIEKNLASARQADADALAKTIAAQIQGLQAQTYALLTPPVQPPPAVQALNVSQLGQPPPFFGTGGEQGTELAGPQPIPPAVMMPPGMPAQPPPAPMMGG